MAKLAYAKFTGETGQDAVDQLNAAIADHSFPVVHLVGGASLMWITHEEVKPGAMQSSFVVIHVTAWVDEIGV